MTGVSQILSMFEDLSFVLPFAAGLVSAFAAGTALRLLGGMRLNLYLVNRDSPLRDQAIIPITEELRRSSLVRSLRQRRWKENVDITLMDYHDQSYTFRIGYDLWKRYYLEVLDEPAGDEAAARINGKPLAPGKRYSLRTGMKLSAGDRLFAVLVTPKSAAPAVHREFVSAA